MGKMTKSEVLKIRNKLDADTSKWMGNRKKVNQQVLDITITAICALDILAKDAPEFILPERAPIFENNFMSIH